MHTSPRLSSFFAPRFWPVWIVLGCLRLLTLLPYRWQLQLGRLLGRLLMKFPNKSYRTAVTNLELCFPNMNKEQQQQLLRNNFESVGIAVFETALGWWGSKRKLQKIKLEVKGFHHLTAALQQGHGVILCSPHFTTLELVGRLFAEQAHFAVMYRPQKFPLIEYITRNALEKHYPQVIARHDIRSMINALRAIEIVWYTPDIDAGIKNSVFVPFFGVTAATITATSRYAKMTNAKVIPGFFYRREDGSGYDVVIEPPLDNFPSGDLTQDALHLNQILEQGILIKPDQYLWQYKRFKTRPPGEKRFYN